MHSFLHIITLLTTVLFNHHNHQASVQSTKLNKEAIFTEGGGSQGKTFFFKIKNDFSSKPRTVAEGFKNTNITNLSILGDKGCTS